MAKCRDWKNIIWSNVRKVVNEILDDVDPNGKYIMYDILHVKSNFFVNDKKLC